MWVFESGLQHLMSSEFGNAVGYRVGKLQETNLNPLGMNT